MLRAYGPGCEGRLIDAERQKIPDGAAWIDLEEPTREEERLVESCLGLDVPTSEELAEIEPSSRLYERNGALYMTLSVLYGVEEGSPASSPIGFVLAQRRLVTVRYVTPKPVRVFSDHAAREPETTSDPLTVLLGLLDAIVDRLADELEKVGAAIEKMSGHVFENKTGMRRIPANRLTALLTRIGRTHMLLAKIRETETSTSRLLSFLAGSGRVHSRRNAAARDRIASLSADTASLSDHSAFLAGHLQFLLDAAVGLIGIEQNAAMKLFSWAALVFLPPALLAGIFGMNFRNMSILDLPHGFPLSLGLMIASSVLPLLYLRRRGWI
jgi:magnesium transporter